MSSTTKDPTTVEPETRTVFTVEGTLDLIVSEMAAAGRPISRDRARTFLTYIENVIAELREFGPVYHVTDEQIARLHDIMDLVMPDDTVAAPGSAYESMQGLLLRRNELSLVHTRPRDGRVQYCLVALELRQV